MGATAVQMHSAIGEESHGHSQDANVVPVPTPTPGVGKKATYAILERIGGGTYGQVYKAKLNTSMGKGKPKIVAVKLLPKSGNTARATTEQRRGIGFKKELRNTPPNVLKLLGWRETHFNVQLILELFDLDLRKYINHQTLTKKVPFPSFLPSFSLPFPSLPFPSLPFPSPSPSSLPFALPFPSFPT